MRTAILAVTMLAGAAPADQPPKPQKAADPNKKICRSESDLGSIVPKSVCHTRAEWAAIGAADARAAEQGRGAIGRDSDRQN